MKILPGPIAFDWDEGNIDKSWEKHKVHFKEVEEVFFNRPLRIFEDEKHSLKEKRLLAYGITNKGRKLTIVFTLRKGKLRTISARDMNKRELALYE